MSLIINETTWINSDPGLSSGAEREISQLDRYLAILESNQHSCRFAPSDAMLALDMAGFVRSRITGGTQKTRMSAARLALAVVQPCDSPQLQ